MSTVWLDTKYISIISSRLDCFKRKNTYTWNFRCPICGDSKKNRFKARGWIYPKDNKLLFHCHNCSITKDVPSFLKELDQSLFNEYFREKYASIEKDAEEQVKFEEFVKKMKPPVFEASTALSELRRVSRLRPDHPVKQYIMNRKIPSEYHYKLYLCMKFKEWTNSIIPGKFENIEKDEPRLIIPFLDEDKELFGYQGRSFKKKDDLRYITIMLDERPKLFGLDTLNRMSHVLVVEGPIDSMFLPNCIASAGGNINTDLDSLGLPKEQFTIIYDNEPRNIHTVKKIEKAMDMGYRVCMLPENIQSKDINDMILSGISREQLVDIIYEHSYSGLQAKLKLSTWRKVQ
jgi:transcription elongation factor Elf1